MITSDHLSELSREELMARLMAAVHEISSLKDERDDYKDKLGQAHADRDRLRAIIAKLERHQFGRRSERLSSDQLQLALEDLAQTVATLDAAAPAEEKSAPSDDTKPPRPPRRANRGALPEHLPREHHFIELEDKTCPCCGGSLHVIGEDISEQLDRVPATLKVKVTHRPRYGCRACEGAVVQAPAPERPIPGGLPTEALLASILIDKYADNLPLYRQAKRFEREGAALDRQTLCGWIGRTCWLLEPLYDYILADILGSPVIFADETTLPVLDPGRGRTKTGYLWAYARDERPWCGERPPAVAYIYEEDRRHQHAIDHLAGFTGILHCDGYGAYDKAFKAHQEASGSGIILAHCNTHARRNYYDIHTATDSPIAAEALRRYAELYAIEADIRGRSADVRLRVRQERSRPLMEDFERWLTQQLHLISGGSDLARAIRYCLSRWTTLSRFLTDGRVEMDTNTVERAIRPQKLTVRNALFAGSDGGARHWALRATLIETCKLGGIDPFAYLRDTLTRITAGHTINRIGELTPWNYKPTTAHPEEVSGQTDVSAPVPSMASLSAR